MLDGREPAPSVETPLHAMLPFRFIVHTHDFATQALTDTTRPEALVREAFGAEVAYVDYFRPGFPLARAVMDLGAVRPCAPAAWCWGGTASSPGATPRRAATTTSTGSSGGRSAAWPGTGERVPGLRGGDGGRRRAHRSVGERAVAVLPKLRAALSRDAARRPPLRRLAGGPRLRGCTRYPEPRPPRDGDSRAHPALRPRAPSRERRPRVPGPRRRRARHRRGDDPIPRPRARGLRATRGSGIRADARAGAASGACCPAWVWSPP